MPLVTRFRRFRTDESGAVTVDWVVLTAAIVVLALIVGVLIRTGTFQVADSIEARLLLAAQ